MKKLICVLTTLSLLVMALCLLTACGEKLPADFAKGEDVRIDNETPFVYDESSVSTVTVKSAFTGKPEERSLDEFVRAWTDDEEAIPYSTIAGYFGNKIVRHFTADGKDSYYTVYSLPDNQIFYLFLCMRDGVLYLDQEYYLYNSAWPIDIRDEYAYTMTVYIYEQDLPSAILGDKLPAKCYLENHTPKDIAKNVEREWAYYYDMCNQVNIPHSNYADQELVVSYPHIRCIQSVSFDIVRDEKGYDGVYVYDLYVHEDGGGVLYFYHLDDQNYLPTYTYTLIQEETISLTAEEVASVTDVMVEWDFANHPTWNPEEFSGFDGSTTYVFGRGQFGGSYVHHLISMWDPTARYPHYHIRKAIEDLVRTHVTVEEGRIYRPDLYEEYEWMQD